MSEEAETPHANDRSGAQTGGRPPRLGRVSELDGTPAAACDLADAFIAAGGVQNGGIDGANVIGAVPDGMRELLAENLLVMLRDLESCSGNDALVSESDVRRGAHTMPLFLAGSDFLLSGFSDSRIAWTGTTCRRRGSSTSR